MRTGYIKPSVENLESLDPALKQLSSMNIRKLRSLLIKRATRASVHVELSEPADDFYFYDCECNLNRASKTFETIYKMGYKRALDDVCAAFEQELSERRGL